MPELLDVCKYLHPGETLVQDYLRPLNMTAAQLAAAIDEDFAHIRQVTFEREGISARLALKLGRYFGTSPELWMNLQVAYDLEVYAYILRNHLPAIVPHSTIKKD